MERVFVPAPIEQPAADLRREITGSALTRLERQQCLFAVKFGLRTARDAALLAVYLQERGGAHDQSA